MPRDLGKVRIVDTSCTKIRDVAVATLMGTDIKAGDFLSRLPEVAVEGALTPETTPRSWEEQLAVGAVEVDLGFEHPGERRWNRDHAAGVGLAVVSLRALEDLALMGGAADLKGLAVEVFAP